MSRRRALTRRARVILWSSVTLMALLLLLPLVGTASDGHLHRAPVLLVGPDVVTSPLRADALASADELDVDAVETRADAVRSLRRGEHLAALVLDLGTTRDEMLIADNLHPRTRHQLQATVRAWEQRFGRSAEVTSVAVPMPQQRTAGYAVFAASAVGILLVALVSARWGPYARTVRRGWARVLALAAAAVLVASVATHLVAHSGASAAQLTGIWAVLAALTLVSGALALACEALAGLGGFIVAALWLLLVPAPLLITGDLATIEAPWSTLLRWTCAGAGIEALAAHGDVDGFSEWRPILVLSGTGLVALIALTAARERSSRSDPGASLPGPARWRAKVAAAVAGGLLGSTLLLSQLPDPDVAETAVQSLAASTECVATGDLRTVADLNRVTRLRGREQFQGGDVGTEIGLQDERRLWLFGDTVRGGADARELVRNSMLISSPDCLRVVVPEAGGAIIPDRDREVGYWPMSLVTDPKPGYDLVTIFAQRVRTTGKGVYDFETLGPAAAEFVVPAGGTPQLLEVRDLGADSADTARPMWGAASYRSGGWLYVYGTSRPERPAAATGFALAVARVRPAQVLQRRAWRYWDGAAWVADEGAARPLIGDRGGVSQTLSVFRRGDTWYAFSKRDEVLGSDLVFWTAPAPQGPFVAQPPVAQVPSDASTGELRYMPLAHPDLLPRRSSMLVSYSRNSTDVGEVLRDPLRYRPRFLRVPLPLS